MNVHPNKKKKKLIRAKIRNYDDGLVIENLNNPEFKNQKNLNESMDDSFEGKKKSG